MGRKVMATRKPFTNTKKLFELPNEVDNNLADELLTVEGEHKRIKGKTSKEQLKTVNSFYAKKPNVTLDEYCDIVYEWLLLNPRVFSVLEYYEDADNRPFEYPMEQVENNERIRHLLEQRIVNLCLTEKVKYGFGQLLLCTKYNWVSSRTSTEQKPDAPVSDNNNDIRFKFGE